MAEYFDTRDEAERFMQEWYAKDRKPPVFFAKIFNNDEEKWIVNYDPRQNPSASPYIKVLENHSGKIRQIVSAAVPPRPQTQPTQQPAVSTDPKSAKAEGETVKCGSCGKLVTVKYRDPGKQIFASRDAIRSLALRCQDCGFIACGECAMPTSGQGGAVCPACKKVGGPYPFTREAELARKKADDIIANAPRLDVKQPDLFVKVLNELITLVKKDNSGFANKPRIREIGDELNRQGGMKLMQQAYYLVRNTGVYFSQDIWHGIGEWEQ